MRAWFGLPILSLSAAQPQVALVVDSPDLVRLDSLTHTHSAGTRRDFHILMMLIRSSLMAVELFPGDISFELLNNERFLKF